MKPACGFAIGLLSTCPCLTAQDNESSSTLTEAWAIVIAAFIPTVVSVVTALFARAARSASQDAHAAATGAMTASTTATSKIEEKMRIRQARLDEKDLIVAERGFSIPVDSNAQWIRYYILRTEKSMSRKDASESVRSDIPNTTDPMVREVV